MKTYENKEYKVVIENERVEITKKAFDDLYIIKMVEGKVIAQSSLALSQAMRCRNIFGF